MNARTLIIGVAAIGLVLIAGCLFFGLGRHRTADQVLLDFHNAEGRAEDMLMDPLILNSRLVAQKVIADVQNPRMDKRIYAIAYLGNERIAEAIPVLRKIVEDERDDEYCRAEALSSIWRINGELGRGLALTAQDRTDRLGKVSREITTEQHRPYHRTFGQALLGVHQ